MKVPIILKNAKSVYNSQTNAKVLIILKKMLALFTKPLYSTF